MDSPLAVVVSYTLLPTPVDLTASLFARAFCLQAKPPPTHPGPCPKFPFSLRLHGVVSDGESHCVASLVFCLAVQFSVIVTGKAKASEEQLNLVWSKASLYAESEELKAMPWYANYRVLSVLLLVVSAALVWQFR